MFRAYRSVASEHQRAQRKDLVAVKAILKLLKARRHSGTAVLCEMVLISATKGRRRDSSSMKEPPRSLEKKIYLCPEFV
jgi:hypothetical protein